MRVHDVAKNKQVAEFELTGAAPAPHPDLQNDGTPVYGGLEHYRPMSKRSAVSANGKYAAVGCTDGIRLVSIPEQKVIGLLPIANATWYRSINFSADGGRLFALVMASSSAGDQNYLKAWSVTTGQLLEDKVVGRHETGPVYPGPIEGLYLASSFIFTKQPLPMDPVPQRIMRVDDDGVALVLVGHQQAPPGTPHTDSLLEKMKDVKRWRKVEIETHQKHEGALFTVKLDWSPAVKKCEPILALLKPRPAAKAADRSAVTVQKPAPPQDGTPPSFAAAPPAAEEGDDRKARHRFGAGRTSLGDDKR